MITEYSDKVGDNWVEYRDPIDLMDCSSNMEIGLFWYFGEVECAFLHII